MAEKIIAQDINDASARVRELFGEPDGVDETDTDLRMKTALAICIQNPDISTNTHIAHNPAAVILDALGVLADVPVNSPLTCTLGRPRQPIDRTPCVIDVPYIAIEQDCAGPFRICYSVREGSGADWLDCHLFYNEAETYDFLVQHFAIASVCLQFMAESRNMYIGNLHIRVLRPTMPKQMLSHFDWISPSLTMDLTPLRTGPFLQSTGALTELRDVLTCDEPPTGISSPFIRKLVAPAMMIQNALNKDDHVAVDILRRSLPVGLDWTVAINAFLELKGI